MKHEHEHGKNATCPLRKKEGNSNPKGTRAVPSLALPGYERNKPVITRRVARRWGGGGFKGTA